MNMSENYKAEGQANAVATKAAPWAEQPGTANAQQEQPHMAGTVVATAAAHESQGAMSYEALCKMLQSARVACGDDLEKKLLISDTPTIKQEQCALVNAAPHLYAIGMNPRILKPEVPAAEVLYYLIYGLALEMGFASMQAWSELGDRLVPVFAASPFHVQNVARLACELPNDVRKHNGRIMLMKLIDMTITHFKPQPQLLLMGIVTGEYMIINFFNSNAKVQTNNCKSVCVSILRYVTPHDEPRRFIKLDELSRDLRERLFLPMRAHFLQLDGILPYPHLVGLPEELYRHIFSYLKLKNILGVTRTCKFLYNLTHTCYCINSNIDN